MNRKGFIDDFIPMLIAAASILLLGIAVVASSVILKGNTKKDVGEFTKEHEITVIMHDYMKSLLEHDGRKVRVIDVIGTNNFEDEIFHKVLYDHTDYFFTSFLPKGTDWYISISEERLQTQSTTKAVFGAGTNKIEGCGFSDNNVGMYIHSIKYQNMRVVLCIIRGRQ